VGPTLVAVGGGFLAAAIFARLGRRVGLPTIPFFMAAGIIFGPNTPGFTLVEHPEDLELLAAIGLILLLFHLGLEFSLGDLLSGGRRLLLAGGIDLALNLGGGFLFGLALGWGTREALIVAGAIGISSSAIATKLLIDLRRLANPESRLILGIIVVEDIFIAFYLALLQPVLGDAEGTAEVLSQIGRAFALLVVLGALARWGSRAVGRLMDGFDDELLTVCFVGLAILVAGVAAQVGVSEAIGAFMVGLVLAETTVAERVERLVLPLRDAFAAVFFFAFGLTIDPAEAGDVFWLAMAAVVLSVVLKVAAGILVGRLHRLGPVASTNIGLSIVARGEFSLILATLAAAAGFDERLGPFVAEYVLATAIIGPLLASRSRWIARRLPDRLFAPAPSPGGG
jgi:CPA2 family monovalent cation:H+ antiporter-2